MIVDPTTLLAFLPAALALNLTPGADMMACVGLGLRAGPRAALAASAGISTGVMAHVAMAGLGLAALIAAFPPALIAIRWAGVAYLLWLAAHALRQGPPRSDAPARSPARAFGQGLAINLLNPKVILFVLAFVPHFTDPARAILPQFLAYGLVLALGGFVINGAVGAFAAGIGHRLATSPGLARGLGLASAAIFAALAIRLALMQRS